VSEPSRRHLPDSRPSRTGKGIIGKHEFYVIVGFYEDNPRSPGEVFVNASKHGSDISLMLNGWSVMVSMALQYGVPWAKIHNKFLHTRGGTQDDESSSFLHAIVEVADKLIQEQSNEP
jgi:hypothetical protein